MLSVPDSTQAESHECKRRIFIFPRPVELKPSCSVGKKGEKPNPIFLICYLTEILKCEQRHLTFCFHYLVKSPFQTTWPERKGTKKKKCFDWIQIMELSLISSIKDD